MSTALKVLAPAITDHDYQRRGIVLRDNTLMIDLAEPRTVSVQGVNTRTGETKDYLLKVTQSGKLLLL